MFYQRNGTALVVNCAVIPNSDVSGVGVRSAFYAQAFGLILLSLFKDPNSIFQSNLSIQVTSAALIGAAYFDPTIDVPHTIVASQFAVLFSACRTTTYDLPKSLLHELKIICQAWVLDIFFRTSLVIFNYSIWSNIIAIQNQPSVCPDGVVQWAIISDAVDIHITQPVTRFAYAYCILDIIWESSRYVAHIARTVLQTSSESASSESAFDQFDPRFWVLQKVTERISGTDIEKWYDWLKCGSFLRKIFSLVFIIRSVETTVLLNGMVQEADNYWTFGQIFQMISLLYLLSVLVCRYSSTEIASRQWVWVKDSDIIIIFACIVVFIGGFLGMQRSIFLIADQDSSWSVWAFWLMLACFTFLGVMSVPCCFLVIITLGGIVLDFFSKLERLPCLPSVAKWASYKLLVPVMRIFGYAIGLIEIRDYQTVMDESETFLMNDIDFNRGS